MKRAIGVYKGGPGSGFHGHAGRPGEVGGSASMAMRDDPLAGQDFIDELAANSHTQYPEDYNGVRYIESSKALAMYRGGGYKYINTWLRKHEYVPSANELYQNSGVMDWAAKVIDAEIQGHTLSKAVMVYRGFYDDELKKQLDTDPSKLIGKEFTDKGFVSTTLYLGTAQHFAESHPDWSGNIVIGMRLPKNYHVAPGVTVEQELILPRNSTFKILSYDKSIGVLNVEVTNG